MDVIDLVLVLGRTEDMFGTDLDALAAGGASAEEVGILERGGREDGILALGSRLAVGHGGADLLLETFALEDGIDRAVGFLLCIEHLDLRRIFVYVPLQRVLIMRMCHRL